MNDDFLSSHSDPIDRLLAIMARLRDPQGGCPWDIEQTYATIVPHTIEEAYEVAEAIEQQDMTALRDELGDLLLQVVYYAQMAREDGLFDFRSVAAGVADKLIRRHPHVFGDATVSGVEDQSRLWEEQKALERQEKLAAQATSGPRTECTEAPVSVLDGVTATLPAITRAVKLQKRAARVGFDWAEAAQIVGKIEEELQEVKDEFAPETPDPERLQDEIGDLLFSVVNLARKAGIDPETALRHTNRKFERRFRDVEKALHGQGRSPADASLDEMEALWVKAKEEHARSG